MNATEVADALIPADHPFMRHKVEADALEAADPHRAWTPADGPMPALYLSHGAPHAFEDAEWMRQWHTWARALPKPTSVLILSAHWEAAPLSITGGQPAELVYDFGGFRPLYYRMRYDTPPAEELVRRTLGVLPDGMEAHEHRSRGLDHGAWVPLKVMYPAADVPVAQLSLPTDDPQRLLALGERLRPLREEGVLLVGSGFMTHGLPFLTREMMSDNHVPGWSSDFDAWAADALQRGDVDELARFRSAAPGVGYAHPTVEHFTPLFVTLGASADPAAPVRTVIDGYNIGLSKRSFEAA